MQRPAIAGCKPPEGIPIGPRDSRAMPNAARKSTGTFGRHSRAMRAITPRGDARRSMTWDNRCRGRRHECGPIGRSYPMTAATRRTLSTEVRLPADQGYPVVDARILADAHGRRVVRRDWAHDGASARNDRFRPADGPLVVRSGRIECSATLTSGTEWQAKWGLVERSPSLLTNAPGPSQGVHRREEVRSPSLDAGLDQGRIAVCR